MHDPELLEEVANLRLAARRFEQLFQGLPIACIGFDLAGTIYEWNKACERLFGLDSKEIFMSSLFRVFCESESDSDRLGEMLDGMIRGESYESFEWTFSTPEERHMLCSMIPKPGQNGEIVGAILAGIDMTAQKAYERRIEEQLAQIHHYSGEIELRRTELEAANLRLASLASTDGLTGLLNHRSFYEELEKAVKSAKDTGATMSVILLDVDNFKTFNDTFGHPEGDAVLRRVAAAMTDAARESDLVARYGGEEFVVLLSDTDKVCASAIAERIRAAIEKVDWPLRQITASFGVATLKDVEDSAEKLVAWADAALYASKGFGKNCVTHIDAITDLMAA